MYRAKAKPQVPGLILVATVAADEIATPVGVLIGRIAFENLGLPAMMSDRLIVIVIGGRLGIFRPVPHELIIPIAPESGVGSRVPLADLGGDVAVAAQLLRPE